MSEPASASTPPCEANPPSRPDSWYEATARGTRDWPPLEEELECDVCVVGGGLTGLSAALHLAERGLQVALLEARQLGSGASGRSGGQLLTGMRHEPAEMERAVGREAAQRFFAFAEEGKAMVCDWVRRYEIPCDLRPGSLSVLHRARFVPEARAHAARLRDDYGYERARFVDRDEVAELIGTSIFYGGLLDRGAWHLHPLNLVLGLAAACRAAGVRLFEHSPVRRYSGTPLAVESSRGRVRSRHLVLGCNGYLGGLEPRLSSRILPLQNFMCATEPLGDVARAINRDDLAVHDSRFVVNYFRLSRDGRLLFGGGEAHSPRTPPDLTDRMRRLVLRIYPRLAGARIDYAWSGTLAITRNRWPHLGCLDGQVWFAHGYSGHGLAMAPLAGRLIAEAIAGSHERFECFARLPMRRFPGGHWLRRPLQVAGMTWYALRDRL